VAGVRTRPAPRVSCRFPSPSSRRTSLATGESRALLQAVVGPNIQRHLQIQEQVVTAYEDQIQGRMKEVQGKIKEAAKKR
jgi:hypothetical protein